MKAKLVKDKINTKYKKYNTLLHISTILSIVGVSSIALNNTVDPVSALTYSEDIDVNFTFDTSLTVSLSSPDIIINDLAPGTSSDSNIVDINVITNNITGYYLTSTVGSNSNATTNLTHGNNINTFTSLATTDSIANTSNFNDNQWGYSYSIDNGITWINANQANGANRTGYSGLPLYNDATHIATLSNKYLPGNDTINFKIAAKASTTQASGTYTNTINFITTAYPSPMNLADSYAYFNKSPIDGYYTMQDMEPGICAMAEENSELTVIDVRDNNTYTIAKLADDRCWMTTNLNLEGGTQLSYKDTDIPEGYTLPVANGFQEGNRLPESSTEGFSDNATAYLYNSHRNTPEDCSTAPGCYSYYSWTAVTAGSGISISTDNTDAPHSVCPINWHLPNTRTGTDDSSDFRILINSIGGTKDLVNYSPNTSPTGFELSSLLQSSPYNFMRAGDYYKSDLINAGQNSFYWFSTSRSDTSALNLDMNANSVHLADADTKSYGFAIRCIANNQ